GDARNLTPHEGDVLYAAGPWAADGTGFYLLTNEGSEFTGLAFYDLGAGQIKRLETPEWDVEFVTVSEDGRYLTWAVNENGYSRLYVREVRSGQLVDHP